MPVLLDRLNTVLPQVKEPQMYATFTGFRLAADGSVFYALAASPPILHWHAAGGDLSDLQEQELPLGLLPVSGADGHFVGRTLIALPGDLLVVATDGILEVCRKDKEEFGVARLQAAIEANAQKTPRELAAAILGAARHFGVQADDQTILIVRRL
jgi:sigma-B regulation protein RsbU (phosphoserine phosphatase)